MKRWVDLFGGGFERLLWDSRLLMLIAVVVCVLLALGTVYVAVVDATRVLGILADYADPSLDSKEATYQRNEAVTVIVRTIDGFLITSILLILACGIYELFVGEIKTIQRTDEFRQGLAADRHTSSCSSLAPASPPRANET